jgi:carbamoyl-phosphate synthase small subunit
MDFNRKLVLADGTVFFGNRLGSGEEVIREIIFQIAKADYQDVLLDPDNYKQIVVMPHGAANTAKSLRNIAAATQSQGASALIVNKYCKFLDEFLNDINIPGLCDVDTDALKNKIREDGVMYAIIADASISDEQALIKLTSAPYVTNHVNQVSPKKPYMVLAANKKFRVALIAFTAKRGLISELTQRNCEVVVLPYNVSAEEIETFAPDGIMLSSGPGDPVELPELLPVIRTLQAKYPLFGICLGHQLFALANGAKTAKMKVGHRSENMPVSDVLTGKILRTFQNHGYHVVTDSLYGTDLEMTQYAIEDEIIEGLRHKKYPAFTVQYHPEANSESQDANYLFDQFVETMGLQFPK